MATNCKQTEADVLEFTAPAALASGEAVLIGAVFVVALGAAASGAAFRGKRTGVWTLPKLGTDTPAAGAKAYWDAANKRTTTSASGNTLIGAYVASYASGTTSADVLLDGVIR
mgnify:CR=1 FL=1